MRFAGVGKDETRKEWTVSKCTRNDQKQILFCRIKFTYSAFLRASIFVCSSVADSVQ